MRSSKSSPRLSRSSLTSSPAARLSCWRRAVPLNQAGQCEGHAEERHPRGHTSEGRSREEGQNRSETPLNGPAIPLVGVVPGGVPPPGAPPGFCCIASRVIDPSACQSYSVLAMADSESKSSLRSWTSLPRPLLLALAIFLCAATTLFALTWMYEVRRPGVYVEIGFNQSRDTFFDPVTSSISIFNVVPGSPAERAGLRPGDQIIGLNAHALISYSLFNKVWS